MAVLTFNDDSLRPGKVSKAEIIEVLDDPMTIELDQNESSKGNPTVMYIGKTQAERLLEIAVEYKEDENHIYHARKANSNHRSIDEASHNNQG